MKDIYFCANNLRGARLQNGTTDDRFDLPKTF